MGHLVGDNDFQLLDRKDQHLGQSEDQCQTPPWTHGELAVLGDVTFRGIGESNLVGWWSENLPANRDH